MSGVTTKPRIFIIPGNGAGDVTNCMWYPWLRDKVLCLLAITKYFPNKIGLFGLFSSSSNEYNSQFMTGSFIPHFK